MGPSVSVTYMQSNLSVPAKSFMQTPKPSKEVAVSAGPRRREISQSPRDQGPSLQRRFQRLGGNFGRLGFGIYHFLTI